MKFLEVNNISLRMDERTILDDITFTQQPFQKIAIAGETGSGKSSLLKIIAGLVQADTGHVLFEDVKVIGPAEKLVPGHKDIYYLSQHFELQKFLRVEQVLAYSNDVGDDYANMIFDLCDITHLLKRKTDELSGGEKQRIAIARILIAAPKLLLLDEPYSNLDMVHTLALKKLIHNISSKLKITCMMISHDATDVLSWADRIIIMKNGRIEQMGAPEKIYRQPKNEYAASLFGRYNVIESSSLPQFLKNYNNEKFIVRPEQIHLNAKGKKSQAVVVRSSKFCGSHYETEVALENLKILALSNHAYKRGEKVFMTIDDDALWPIH